EGMRPARSTIRHRHHQDGCNLYNEDEGLVESALSLLSPPFEPTPDGDESARKSGCPSSDATQEASHRIQREMLPSNDHRTAEHHEQRVRNQQDPTGLRVVAGRGVQQDEAPEREAGRSTHEEDRKAAPDNVAAQSPYHQCLTADTANHHDLDGPHRVV